MASLEFYKEVPIYNICPNCKLKTFQRYVLPFTSLVIGENVGKCNNEKCNYQYTVLQYQRTNNIISDRFVNESLKDYNNNNLFIFLKNKFGKENALRTVNMYSIGTSKKYPGASILWEITKDNLCIDGRIILFDPNTGKENLKNSISFLLKIKNYESDHTIFGENLLTLYPLRTIALVKRPIDAIIAECKYPENYLWLSVGGIRLNDSNKNIFEGRECINASKFY